jgi:type II secretory pathway pseudopilin PulG
MTTKFKKSFTLLELLIAIFVLTVGILAVFQAFPLGVHIQKSAQMDTVANQLCQAKMEEISSLSYGEISLGISDDPYGSIVSFPSYKRRTEISYFDPNNPSVPPALDSGIKKIKITVFWHSTMGISEKQVIITNLIAQR